MKQKNKQDRNEDNIDNRDVGDLTCLQTSESLRLLGDLNETVRNQNTPAMIKQCKTSTDTKISVSPYDNIKCQSPNTNELDTDLCSLKDEAKKMFEGLKKLLQDQETRVLSQLEDKPESITSNELNAQYRFDRNAELDLMIKEITKLKIKDTKKEPSKLTRAQSKKSCIPVLNKCSMASKKFGIPRDAYSPFPQKTLKAQKIVSTSLCFEEKDKKKTASRIPSMRSLKTSQKSSKKNILKSIENKFVAPKKFMKKEPKAKLAGESFSKPGVKSENCLKINTNDLDCLEKEDPPTPRPIEEEVSQTQCPDREICGNIKPKELKKDPSKIVQKESVRMICSQRDSLKTKFNFKNRKVHDKLTDKRSSSSYLLEKRDLKKKLKQNSECRNTPSNISSLSQSISELQKNFVVYPESTFRKSDLENTSLYKVHNPVNGIVNYSEKRSMLSKFNQTMKTSKEPHQYSIQIIDCQEGNL
ncbi:unnamed protein product [Moneuplotes crassus]|uniref:Uncharacterized protein n=2 Tax=Euplotes crassus TaxID=5936 RepID=A0AAD1UAJ0_EUPCR|nr:unnamed protein product [Moneuplotes crassus]